MVLLFLAVSLIASVILYLMDVSQGLYTFYLTVRPSDRKKFSFHRIVTITAQREMNTKERSSSWNFIAHMTFYAFQEVC